MRKYNLKQNIGIGVDVIKPNHHINIAYVGEVVGGEMKKKSDEDTELRWFNGDELKQLDTFENVKESGLKAIEICKQ